MADAKISQLPVATTPLAGTELVPIVQSATTKQTTVDAVIAAAAASSTVVAASDIGTAPNQIPLNQYLGTLAYQDATSVLVNALSATGNVVLGDASTDTVQVNGYMGVGGAPDTSAGLKVTSAALQGGGQIGIWSEPTVTSGATTNAWAYRAQVKTVAAAFTVGQAYGLRVINPSLGAGSAITTNSGVRVDDMTAGVTNYGFESTVSSGANKWNIYASGTAANYFAGNVGIGTTSPTSALTVFTGDFELNGGTAARGLKATIEANVSADALVAFNSQISSNNAAMVFRTNSVDRVWVGSTETVINDPGNDYDFRVESGTNTHALFVEGTNSNVKIGGSAERATTVGTNHLDIFNGTAPVGTLSNGISIYSSAGEAYVMDAAGNATLFSPHDAETNEWIFKSKHTPTGKVLKIDVERLLRFVNDHFGLDAVQEFIEE